MNIVAIRNKLTPFKETGHRARCGDHVIKIMPGGSNVPRKEGELMKYRNVWHGWGKRYFRLERTYLHYFETKHGFKPLQTITRGEIVQVKPSNAFPDKTNVFEVQIKDGTVWYCQASCPAEMISWMQALSTVPIIIDANRCEPGPSETEPFEIVQPASNFPPPPMPEQGCSIHSSTPSPYREVHNDAHCVAHTQGYHGHDHKVTYPDTPPPPYSEKDDQPPKFPDHYPK